MTSITAASLSPNHRINRGVRGLRPQPNRGGMPVLRRRGGAPSPVGCYQSVQAYAVDCEGIAVGASLRRFSLMPGVSPRPRWGQAPRPPVMTIGSVWNKGVEVGGATEGMGHRPFRSMVLSPDGVKAKPSCGGSLREP